MEDFNKLFDKSDQSIRNNKNSSNLNTSQNIHLFSTDQKSSDKIRKQFNLLHHFDRKNVLDLGITNTHLDIILNNEDLKKSLKILISNHNFFNISDSLSNLVHVNKHLKNQQCTSLCYQRHFGTDDNHYDFNDIGLGHFRSLKSNIEVYLREIDHLHFNLNAIKSSDIPCNTDSSLTGLTAEEACQIMRYAGESINLKLVTFEYNDKPEDFDDKSAELLAMMVWYLVEGASLPQNHPSTSDDFKSYIVELHEVDYTLEFLQSTLNDKWWAKSLEGKYLPCSYEDYQKTINNNIPPRILNFLTIQ